jgi:16S rRNA (adenine1518-N6/adenine1519-N6)-dimethyltransferase
MQTLTQIKALLESKGLSPRKAFGQNFLIDHNLIRKLVDASGVKAGDVVLEIGPGTGTLTEELLARGCFVVAAEIDRGLSDLLREQFASAGERFVLVQGDCLDGKKSLAPPLLAAVDAMIGVADRAAPNPHKTFRLVSNLPYGPGTTVMAILLADLPRCVGQAVTIQKEVAERLLAPAGSRDFGPISVLAQAVAHVKVVATLPPECFWPRPDVTSAMVTITRRADPLTHEPRVLLDIAQKIFERRRKQLGGALAGLVRDGFEFPDGVVRTQRAEELSITQFVALARAIRAQPPAEGRPGRD